MHLWQRRRYRTAKGGTNGAKWRSSWPFSVWVSETGNGFGTDPIVFLPLPPPFLLVFWSLGLLVADSSTFHLAYLAVISLVDWWINVVVCLMRLLTPDETPPSDNPCPIRTQLHRRRSCRQRPQASKVPQPRWPYFRAPSSRRRGAPAIRLPVPESRRGVAHLLAHWR